ncbi:hypothetical protein niasHT_033044 [Heterodera trifolii]|uniref:Uncharacterized protein n=1 Tax=Heterodera trifolii TaxID=157864 RepID=A0ABD2IWY3_9BILA
MCGFSLKGDLFVWWVCVVFELWGYYPLISSVGLGDPFFAVVNGWTAGLLQKSGDVFTKGRLLWSGRGGRAIDPGSWHHLYAFGGAQMGGVGIWRDVAVLMSSEVGRGPALLGDAGL